MLDAEVGGWPWLSRIGRALLALDAPGTAPGRRAVRPWGAAVVTFVDGLGRRADRAAAGGRGPVHGARRPGAGPVGGVPGRGALSARRAANRARTAGASAAPVDPAPRYGGPGRWDCGTCRPWSTPGRAGARSAHRPIVRGSRPAPPRWGRSPRCRRRRRCRSNCACSAAPRSRSTGRRWTSRPCARVRGRPCGCWRCARGTRVHRDALVASLWPDVDEEAALRSLQVAISSLRSVLGGPLGDRGGRLDAAGRNGESYCLSLPPGGRSDVLDFDARLADGARRAARTATPRSSGRRSRRPSGTTAGTCCPRRAPPSGWSPSGSGCGSLRRGRLEALGRRLGDDGELRGGRSRRCASGLRLDAYPTTGWRLLVDLHDRRGQPRRPPGRGALRARPDAGRTGRGTRGPSPRGLTTDEPTARSRTLVRRTARSSTRTGRWAGTTKSSRRASRSASTGASAGSASSGPVGRSSSGRSSTPSSAPARPARGGPSRATACPGSVTSRWRLTPPARREPGAGELDQLADGVRGAAPRVQLGGAARPAGGARSRGRLRAASQPHPAGEPVEQVRRRRARVQIGGKQSRTAMSGARTSSRAAQNRCVRSRPGRARQGRTERMRAGRRPTA